MFFNKAYRVSQYPGIPAASTRKFYKRHKGVDYATPAGTPITVPFKANLAYQGQQRGYGNRTAVTNPETGKTYFFSHLSKMLPLPQTMGVGTTIGYTGGVPGASGAGWTTGAHVDVEAYDRNKVPVFSQRSTIPRQVSPVSRSSSSRRTVSRRPSFDLQAIMKQVNNLPGRKIAVSSNRARLEEMVKKRGGRIVRISL